MILLAGYDASPQLCKNRRRVPNCGILATGVNAPNLSGSLRLSINEVEADPAEESHAQETIHDRSHCLSLVMAAAG